MINGVFNVGLIRKFTPNRRSSHVVKDPHETLLVSDVKLPLSIQGTIAQHRLQLSVSQLSVWNLVLIFYSAAFGDFSEFSFIDWFKMNHLISLVATLVVLALPVHF